MRRRVPKALAVLLLIGVIGAWSSDALERGSASPTAATPGPPQPPEITSVAVLSVEGMV